MKHIKIDRAFIAFLWVLLSVVSFCTMAISAREITQTMPVFAIMTLRAIFMLGVITIAIAASQKGFAQLKTQHFAMHVQRNCWHIIGQSCWIWGISLIALVQVFALEFTAPLWVALLAPFFLNERLGIYRILAIALGFTGALIILRPGFIEVSFGSLVVIIAAIGFAGSMICTKRLTNTDTTLTILFYMALTQLPITAAIAGSDLRLPTLAELPSLLFLSVGAIVAHFSLTTAYRYAAVTFVGAIDFLRIPIIAVMGYYLYGEHLDIFLAIGTIFMIAGNYLNLRSMKQYERRKEK